MTQYYVDDQNILRRNPTVYDLHYNPEPAFTSPKKRTSMPQSPTMSIFSTASTLASKTHLRHILYSFYLMDDEERSDEWLMKKVNECMPFTNKTRLANWKQLTMEMIEMKQMHPEMVFGFMEFSRYLKTFAVDVSKGKGSSHKESVFSRSSFMSNRESMASNGCRF